MENKELYEARLHYIMSAIGGFFGAYALLNRFEVFGSSQTSNMIEIIVTLLGKNFNEFFTRSIALLLYMSGITLSVLLTKRTRADVRRVSILIDFSAILLLGFLPKEMNDVVALYPIFFAMAMQWTSFSGGYGFVSASIFSTNNLKQATSSVVEYLCDKDKVHLKKAKFFGLVLLSFHIGAGISYLAHTAFQIRGAWVCFGLLIIALLAEIKWYPKNSNR